VEFTINIDVSGFQQLAKEFPVRFKAALAAAAQRSNDLIKEELSDYIEMQAGNWPPLNKEYEASKRRAGYDSRILIRSRLMAQAIQSRRIGFGGWVGIPTGIKWPSGLAGKASWLGRPRKGGSGPVKEIASVMRAHEDGRGHNPKRAWFEPVRNLVRERVIGLYRKALQDALGQ
jgi:hypothetical protein